MTTYADCLAGVCPCSRPEQPAPDHQCPPDGLTIDEREREFERQNYRPYEEDEGTSIHWP
jgi:hypothetical protein